jgi:peptide/nickel transport system permease protein
LSLRGYIARRLAHTVILVIFLIVLNWVIFQLMPGVQGSIGALIGRPSNDVAVREQVYQNYLRLYGLDRPPLERFATYFWDMLTFNLGTSFQTNHPVLQDMVQSGRLENTIILIGSSTVLSIVIGISLGILAAHKRGGVLDNFWVSTSLTTYSFPTFWMGLSFILIFALTLGWFPAGNTAPNEWAQGGALLPSLPVQILVRLQYLFLPTLTLTLFSYGGFLLLTRATMLETLGDDYIVTARAKGLKERTVLFHHAFRNASLPIVTASALAFGFLLSGAIVTETIFNWDGLGLWLFHAIGWKDFPVMQAMFYILGLSVIAANFISDMIYGIIDPRIKYG